jgi:hypothetical protein
MAEVLDGIGWFQGDHLGGSMGLLLKRGIDRRQVAVAADLEIREHWRTPEREEATDGT